jgi:hypothetical protein
MRWQMLLSIFLVCVGCCAVQAQGQTKPEPRLKALSASHDSTERAYLCNMCALFRIVDPRYLEKVLVKAPDCCHFRERITDWINDDPGRWDVIRTRLDYCADLRKRGRLGTDIDDPALDVRWQLYLENGAPGNELVLPGDCGGSNDTCTVWTLIWPPDSLNQRGLEISCWSGSRRNYPTEIISDESKDFPYAFPIWPFVNYSKFPAADATADLWFSVWVPGDQFTRPTLDSGRLNLRIDLFDSSRTLLIASQSDVSSLQMIRGILEATKRRDRYLIRAMGYLGFTGIKPGKYNAHLMIAGARDNEGENWLKVEIPAESRTSDLLILEPSVATGGNVLPGIVRGGRTMLFDNPECRFAADAELNLYLETTLPKDHGENFQVLATLLPVPEVSGLMQGEVTAGKPIVVADSLDQPFLNGEWQSEQNRKLIEELVAFKSHPRTKAVTVLKEQFEATPGVIAVKVNPRLESGLKSGKYLLTVTISDPKKQNYFLSARRFIRVAAASWWTASQPN